MGKRGAARRAAAAGALHLAAAPQGTRVVVHGARPGDAFAPRTPGLEDVYYLALASAGLAGCAEAA